MNAIGFAEPAGPKAIQAARSAGADPPSAESEPGSGVTPVGTECGRGFRATLAKVSQGRPQGEQKGKVASEEETDESDAGSDLLTEATTGLVVLVPLISPVVNQGQDKGQGPSKDVALPVAADGEAGSPGLLPVSQDASTGKKEIGAVGLTALLQEAGSPDSLGQNAPASAQAPEGKSTESHVPGAVLQPDVVRDQVAADALLSEIPGSEASAAAKPDQHAVQVLSIRQAAGESSQSVVGQSLPVLNGDEETPAVGHGSDDVIQTLSREAPQSVTGDQFLDHEGHGSDRERGGSQGQGEVMGMPSPLDTSAHRAEVLVRAGDPPFRSELTKAAERAAPAPVEPPAAVVSNTGGTMRLQFDPPDLGRVTVQVSVQAQQVHATVSVQHQGLGEFLATSQGALDDAMRQHGLRVEEFRVDTDTGRAGQGQQFGEQLPGFQDRESGRSSGRSEAEDVSLVEVGAGEESSRSRSLHHINLFA